MRDRQVVVKQDEPTCGGSQSTSVNDSRRVETPRGPEHRFLSRLGGLVPSRPLPVPIFSSASWPLSCRSVGVLGVPNVPAQLIQRTPGTLGRRWPPQLALIIRIDGLQLEKSLERLMLLLNPGLGAHAAVPFNHDLTVPLYTVTQQTSSRSFGRYIQVPCVPFFPPTSRSHWRLDAPPLHWRSVLPSRLLCCIFGVSRLRTWWT